MADCVEGVVGQEGEEVVNGEGNEHVGMEEEEIGHQVWYFFFFFVSWTHFLKSF